MNKNSLTFLGCNSDYDKSKIVMFGAPFDGTTSFRPGTRFAPNAIRIDSYGLEPYSPYFDLDINDFNIIDIGDVNVNVGGTSNILDEIGKTAQSIVNDDKIPFMIGGEHLVSLPAIRAVAEKYTDVRVVHLDAHTDLRDIYLGNELSHATVLKKVWEILGDDRIYQYGIRSGDRSEFAWARQHVHLNPYNCEQLFEDASELSKHKIYITVDLDVLDPSVFPGTGTPEPGGISFNDMLRIIKLFSELDIVGMDIVELSPHYDASGVSTAVACKIIRESLLAIMK